MGVTPGVTNGGVILTGPSADGTSGQVLQTNGSGALSFASVDTSGLQPLDADLTAIAALSTTAFGRSVLTTADAAALLTLAGGIGGSTGSTDNRLVKSDGTGGKTVSATGITVDDSDNVTGAATIRATTSIGIASKPYLDSSADGKYAIRNSSGALLLDFGESTANRLTAQGDVSIAGNSYRINGSEFATSAFPTIGINPSGTWTNVSITKLLALVPGTPSQITSNQNNYAPTAASILRLSSDASRDITGLAIGQIAGSRTEFWNVGAQNIVLKHADSNSTAANQFTNNTGADITLAAGEEASLKYDGTTSRWRVRKIA